MEAYCVSFIVIYYSHFALFFFIFRQCDLSVHFGLYIIDIQIKTLVLQRTLSPSIPPRLPERPNIPARYPIISTKNLIDVSDAPLPPPRKNAPGTTNTFVSHITRNDVNGHSGASSPLHQIHFTEVGKNSNKLKLCNSTDQRKTSLSSTQHFNSDHRPRPTPRPSISQPHPNSLSVLKPPVPGKNPFGVLRNRTQVIMHYVLVILIMVTITWFYLMYFEHYYEFYSYTTSLFNITFF